MSEKVCPQCGTEYPAEQRFCPADGSPLRSKGGAADLTGTVIADRYLVLQTLGEGGMGRVYLAEHVRMGRKCALKVMNPKMASDTDAISRFNREAANACKISHPHVAAVYDFGETSDGLIYLAMEYVDGAPLTRLVEQLGALPPKRAAAITKQTADALAAAHELGIVHRDLKPDNIMITRNRDGSDCVKVVDFGIAKVADNDAQKVTKTGLVVGTPEYMSPEQLAGDKLDGRSDVYSLALVAFNMLTGKLPFPADSQQEAMIMRLTDKPRKLSEMAPMVAWPSELQGVIDKALERDMKARFQSSGEFGRAFVHAIDENGAASAGTEIIAASVPTAPPSTSGATRELDAASAQQVPLPSASHVQRLDDSPGGRGSSQPVPATVAASVGGSRGSRPFKSWAIAAILLLGIGGGVGAVMLLKGGNKGESARQVTTGGAATSDSTAALNNQLGSTPTLNERFKQVEALTTPDTNFTGKAAQRNDSVRAVQALVTLDSAAVQLRTSDDSAYAQLLRAEALFAASRVPDGCRLLKTIDRGALGSRKARVERLNNSLCSATS